MKHHPRDVLKKKSFDLSASLHSPDKTHCMAKYNIRQAGINGFPLANLNEVYHLGGKESHDIKGNLSPQMYPCIELFISRFRLNCTRDFANTSISWFKSALTRFWPRSKDFRTCDCVRQILFMIIYICFFGISLSHLLF
jgi:hypothetical protein